MSKKTIKSRLFVDSLIVNTASLVEKIVFFIANIIVARYLSVEHFGEYATALAYATFFSYLTDIGINSTLVRALNLEAKYSNEHFTNAFIVKGALAIVMYSIMLLSLSFTGFNLDVLYLTMILGMVRIGNEFMKTYYAVDEARQKFIFPSVVNIIYVLMFLAGIIAVVICGGNYYHISFVRLAVVIGAIVILSFHVFRKFTFVINRYLTIQFIKTTIPFSVIAVLWNFSLRINAIIISLILGTKEVGIFTNSIVFVDTLSIIPNNIQRIIRPALYKALEKNDIGKFQFAFDILTKYFGIISFYIMIVLVFFSGEIITKIFAGKYYEAIPVLEVLALAVPFVFNMASIIIIGLDKQVILAYILTIATVINIFMNILFIHIWGLSGAAFAVVFTYGIIFISGHIYLAYKAKLSLNRVLQYYIILIGVSTLCYYVYKLWLTHRALFFSFTIVSVLYCVLVLLMMMKKDDIRIIREMVSINKGNIA